MNKQGATDKIVSVQETDTGNDVIMKNCLDPRC